MPSESTSLNPQAVGGISSGIPGGPGDDLAALEELLSQLDPETLKSLMRLGTLGDQQALLGVEYDRASQAASTPLAQGTHVAGTYVAAHPLEHLSVGLQRAMGLRDQREVMGARPVDSTGKRASRYGTLAEQAAGRTSYADALAKQARELAKRRIKASGQPDPYLEEE